MKELKNNFLNEIIQFDEILKKIIIIITFIQMME